MTISKTMTAALRAITSVFDGANTNNLMRWGEELQFGVSITTGVCGTVRDYRTLHALAAAGLIELTAHSNTAESLRRGAYGKWIGGTKRERYTTFTARPTDAGRAYLASLESR